jgi:hypothetical protein
MAKKTGIEKVAAKAGVVKVKGKTKTVRTSKRSKAKPRTDMAQRNAAIVAAAKSGTPSAEIAKAHGLSQIRVKQLLWQVKTGRVKVA